MLKSLKFQNYRCFGEHTLPLKVATIVVGRNNAGKSTLIEGLRLVGIITERYANLSYGPRPDWLEDVPLGERGVRVDLSGLNLSWKNLFHRYQDPPAVVTATFSNRHSITVYLGPEHKIHATIRSADGDVIRTKAQTRGLDLPLVSVLPQVGPLVRDEVILRPDYVRANLSSYLSPAHFRNQLNIFYSSHFNAFKQLVENTWPGLQILELEGRGEGQGEELSLLVRDGDFAAEVGWMGHGLQMWLQVMWFLTSTTTLNF